MSRPGSAWVRRLLLFLRRGASWHRRSVVGTAVRLPFSAVTRLCERPGCSVPAEVAYGFDASQRTVWLDAMVGEPDARAGALCRRHADTMGIPLGWTLDDRREAIPRLFRSTPSVVSPSGTAVPRRRTEPPTTTEQLRLDELSGGDRSPEAPSSESPGEPADRSARPDASADGGGRVADAAAPSHESVSASDAPPPWLPRFDQSDDLQGLLDASGPLLSRAFGLRAHPED